jgi:hypothetical protein
MRVPPGIEIPFTIGIANGVALPSRTMMLIRGLPAGFQLSKGRSFGSGVWVVPTTAIGNLAARVPADAKGKAEITVAITTLEGSALIQKQPTLIFSAAPAATVQHPAIAGPPPVLSPPPATETAATPQANVP